MDTDVEICLADVDQLQSILMTTEELQEEGYKCVQMSRPCFLGSLGRTVLGVILIGGLIWSSSDRGKKKDFKG